MYRMLLFDLDGTLLRSDKTISDRTKAALELCRKAGYFIGISTSRGWQSTCAFLDAVKPDVLISSGGALIQRRGASVYQAELTPAETETIIARARAVCGSGCAITVDTLDTHYRNFRTPPEEMDKSWGDIVYTDLAQFSEPALKVCVEIPDEAQAGRLKAALPECDCVRFSDGFWYKFTRRGITKRKALEEACRACGIRPEELISFGDDYADIEMLEASGLGVAMGNAIPEVKAAADVVIGGNDEDGIARWLEQLTAGSV